MQSGDGAMIYVGTAGYSYKDWIGPFYPEGIKESNMLEYYSARFDFMEVNSSFYHMPRLSLFESMDRKTPAGFRFAVKLFGGFTHERTSGETDAGRFRQALEPLLESGKLICLLAQFPYSFHFSMENMSCLKRIRQWFDGIRVNVEFRNQEWIRRETIIFLKGEGLGFVCVDGPRIRGLVKNVVTSTSDVGYIRLHGRNAEKWYGGEGSERYDYLYERNELLEWVSGIRELEGRTGLAVVSFNNHPVGKAVENAKMLKQLLSG